jgi:hypothetical protein
MTLKQNPDCQGGDILTVFSATSHYKWLVISSTPVPEMTHTNKSVSSPFS